MSELQQHHTWTATQLQVQHDDALLTTLDAPGPEPTEVVTQVAKSGRQRTGSFAKETSSPTTTTTDDKKNPFDGEEDVSVDERDGEDEEVTSQAAASSPKVPSESNTPATASPRIDATPTTSATPVAPAASTWTDADTTSGLARVAKLRKEQQDLEDELEQCIEREGE